MVKKKSIENERFVGVLSYFVIGIIWYYADERLKKSKFVRYHIKVSLMIILLAILFNFIVKFLIFIPFVRGLIQSVLSLFIFFVWVYGLVVAVLYKTKAVPLITLLVERLFKF